MTRLIEVITDALVDAARRDLARTRSEALARPVGMQGIQLGITDYRKPPDPDINAHDWAVWLVRWDGSEWRRIKRLSANLSLTEAHAAIARHGANRKLPRIE